VLFVLNLDRVDLLFELDEGLLEFQRGQFHREWEMMPARQGKIKLSWSNCNQGRGSSIPPSASVRSLSSQQTWRAVRTRANSH
jgi:hypothetical protein